MLNNITRKTNIKALELSSFQFGLKVHNCLKYVQIKRKR